MNKQEKSYRKEVNLLAKYIKLRAYMLKEWRNKTWNLDSSRARQHLEGGLEEFEPLQKGLGRQQRHSSRRGGGGTHFHMADRIWWVMSSWGENYSGNCQRHAGAQLLDWACCSDWEWQSTEGKNRQKWLPRTWAGGTVWNPVFWDWVFWQSFTDTQDPGGNGEGENSEKGSREGRGKLAAEKNKITVA